MSGYKEYNQGLLFYPPASEVSREVANLTERKNLQTPVNGVKEFVCLSVCLFIKVFIKASIVWTGRGMCIRGNDDRGKEIVPHLLITIYDPYFYISTMFVLQVLAISQWITTCLLPGRHGNRLLYFICISFKVHHFNLHKCCTYVLMKFDHFICPLKIGPIRQVLFRGYPLLYLVFPPAI